MVTHTADGIPGDPLNVGLVGTKEEAITALAAAGWQPADPVTLKTSLEIADSVVFDRSYRDAPVSPLFYEGRKQDFAFEKAVGRSADRRHHVRFWRVLEEGSDGRPVFLGSATFDRSAGISHYTGAITHHIAADIDAERDMLIVELTAAGMIGEIYQVTGVGPTLFGRNGGGDRYYTDGEVRIGSINAGAAVAAGVTDVRPNPPVIRVKDRLWSAVRNALNPGGSP
jgi:hypothetical protein